MADGSTKTPEPDGNGRPGRRTGVGLRTRITLPLLLPVLGLLLGRLTRGPPMTSKLLPIGKP